MAVVTSASVTIDSGFPTKIDPSCAVCPARMGTFENLPSANNWLGMPVT
jgi:hypothetical protein